MGLFDIVKNLFGGASDLAQGPIQDAIGGLGEIPGVQEIQDAVGGATEAATSASEKGQSAVEEVTNKLGL